MKRITIVIILVVIVLGGIGSIVSLRQGDELGIQAVSAHEDDVDIQGINGQDIADLVTYLEQMGVPAKYVQIISDDDWDPPIVIEFILRSASKSDEVAPDDVIHLNIIAHAVNLAHNRGLNVGGFNVTIINTEGNEITSVTETTDVEITPELVPPRKLENNAVSNLLNQEFPLHGMSLDNLDVSLDSEGIRWVTFELSVPNIETANAKLSDFMLKLFPAMVKMNLERDTQVAVYQVRLNTSTGEPLLKYINDLQIGRRGWWYADGLTKEWFSTPPAPKLEPMPKSVSTPKLAPAPVPKPTVD